MCLALTPANLGRLDETFELLEQGVVERDGLMRSLPAWESLMSLRRDPRYSDLLERVGLDPG